MKHRSNSEDIDILLKTSQTKHRSCLGSYETLKSSCKHPPDTFTPVRPVHVWLRSAGFDFRSHLFVSARTGCGDERCVYIILYKYPPLAPCSVFSSCTFKCRWISFHFCPTHDLLSWDCFPSEEFSLSLSAKSFLVIFSGRPRRVYHITDV